MSLDTFYNYVKHNSGRQEPEGLSLHPHALKHGLSEEDIFYSWQNFVSKRHRLLAQSNQIIAVGLDKQGRFVQMVGVITKDGIMVYHAMSPPTKSFLAEIGLARR